MTHSEIQQTIQHEKWVKERRVIADNRITNCLRYAKTRLTSTYNNPNMRVFAGVKRFSLI